MACRTGGPPKDGEGVLASCLRRSAWPPLKVRDFFRSLWVCGDCLVLSCVAWGLWGMVARLGGSTRWGPPGRTPAGPLEVLGSRAERCRMNWTSLEYSPHFMSICEERCDELMSMTNLSVRGSGENRLPCCLWYTSKTSSKDKEQRVSTEAT